MTAQSSQHADDENQNFHLKIVNDEMCLQDQLSKTNQIFLTNLVKFCLKHITSDPDSQSTQAYFEFYY